MTSVTVKTWGVCGVRVRHEVFPKLGGVTEVKTCEWTPESPDWTSRHLHQLVVVWKASQKHQQPISAHDPSHMESFSECRLGLPYALEGRGSMSTFLTGMEWTPTSCIPTLEHKPWELQNLDCRDEEWEQQGAVLWEAKVDGLSRGYQEETEPLPEHCLWCHACHHPPSASGLQHSACPNRPEKRQCPQLRKHLCSPHKSPVRVSSPKYPACPRRRIIDPSKKAWQCQMRTLEIAEAGHTCNRIEEWGIKNVFRFWFKSLLKKQWCSLSNTEK